jgi:hypothetical protein
MRVVITHRDGKIERFGVTRCDVNTEEMSAAYQVYLEFEAVADEQPYELHRVFELDISVEV